MDNRSKQPFLKSPGVRRFVFFVLVIFSAIVVMSIISLYPKSRDAIQNRNQAKAELENLNNKELELRMKIESLNTAEGQEEALRGKYHVADEGEGVVVIIEEEKPDEVEKKSFFDSIRSSFDGDEEGL
jgi:cell division protein FtsB